MRERRGMGARRGGRVTEAFAAGICPLRISGEIEKKRKEKKNKNENEKRKKGKKGKMVILFCAYISERKREKEGGVHPPSFPILLQF